MYIILNLLFVIVGIFLLVSASIFPPILKKFLRYITGSPKVLTHTVKFLKNLQILKSLSDSFDVNRFLLWQKTQKAKKSIVEMSIESSRIDILNIRRTTTENPERYFTQVLASIEHGKRFY